MPAVGSRVDWDLCRLWSVCPMLATPMDLQVLSPLPGGGVRGGGGVVVCLAWAPACGPVGRLGATRVLGAPGLCAGRACVGQLGRPPQPCQQVVPGDGLRESLLCRVQPSRGPMAGGKTCILFQSKTHGMGFQVGQLWVILQVVIWVNKPAAVLSGGSKGVCTRLGRFLPCPAAVGLGAWEGGARGTGSWADISCRQEPGAWVSEGPGVWGVGVAIPLLLVGPGPHVLDSGSLYQRVELEFDICFYNHVCYCSGNLEF